MISIPFTYKDKKYRLDITPSNHTVGSMGCHVSIQYGFGAARVQGIYEINPLTGGASAVKSKYNPWGDPLTSGTSLVLEAFEGRMDELKALIYGGLVKQYEASGAVIFSDHINEGSKVWSSPGMKIIGDIYGSPAALAKWLAENAGTMGPCYASPIFHSPLHSTEAGGYTLCQVFTWIPKRNEWSLMTDVSAVPCVKDEKYTSKTFMTHNPCGGKYKEFEAFAPTYK